MTIFYAFFALFTQCKHNFFYQFRVRKVVVICERKITHLPLSSFMQASSVVVLLLLACWMVYSSHYVLSFNHKLIQKDGIIAESVSTHKTLLTRIEEMQSYLNHLEDYMEQHKVVATPPPDTTLNIGKKYSALEGDALSNTVKRVTNNTAHTVARINEHIDHQIALIEKSIEDTGFPFHRGGPFEAADDTTLLEATIKDKLTYLSKLESLVSRLPFALPIKNATMTSRFGVRRDPIRRRYANHKGLDFAGPYKASIMATEDGIVKRAGRYGAYGKFVEIDHGLGITTRYAHLSKILVKKGQTVHKGKIIGKQGSTGRSTGAHLHYEIRYQNKALDPQKFIMAGQNVHKTAKLR